MNHVVHIALALVPLTLCGLLPLVAIRRFWRALGRFGVALEVMDRLPSLATQHRRASYAAGAVCLAACVAMVASVFRIHAWEVWALVIAASAYSAHLSTTTRYIEPNPYRAIDAALECMREAGLITATEHMHARQELENWQNERLPYRATHHTHHHK